MKKTEHFVWTQSTTDITLRWRRMYGYIPASETPDIQTKWREWKEMLARELPDVSAEEMQKILIRTRKKHNA